MTAQRANAEPAPAIRWRHELEPSDAAAIRSLVAETGFFTSEEVDVAEELALERLAKGARSGYEFLIAEDDQGLVGYTCFGRIACTDASYDLYWIAVSPQRQRSGIGRLLMQRTERAIAELGGERIYIETSGKPQYVPTQGFYRRCGYQLEATLKDFYRRDDDKLIFVRALETPSTADNA